MSCKSMLKHAKTPQIMQKHAEANSEIFAVIQIMDVGLDKPSKQIKEMGSRQQNLHRQHREYTVNPSLFHLVRSLNRYLECSACVSCVTG